jgi:hypothetical protein
MGGVILALHAPPATAQAETTQAIQDATIIDIPFVLDGIDPNPGVRNLWVTREQEANAVLARLWIKPVQVAVLGTTPPSQSKPLLWRAFTGGGLRLMRSDELQLAQGPRYFCGAARRDRGLACFIDEDGDGDFDHVAEGRGERGSKPYHVTIIKTAKALDAPQPYQILADDQRPPITIELRNCERDYDRPRYAALSTEDRNVPVTPTGFGWLEKDSSLATCRRGSQLDRAPGTGPSVPNGGYLAELGPLIFTVGPKSDAKLNLVGPVDSAALYRLEGASLVDMRVGRTPAQAQLLALKKFPYPIMMADEGAVIQNGVIEKGARLATIPFHHAYRGKLTQDIAIKTLFGKRSLAAGTIVYGFPAKSQLTMSRGGIPVGQSVGDDEYRDIKLELTWCAPVQVDEQGKEKLNAIGKGGWSAACIPHSVLGNHTIITDLQPAFGVSGVSYRADTSSNGGPPPIERVEDSSFAQPLHLDYVYDGREGEFIALKEQIYFGDQLTSSSPERLYAPSGKLVVEIAGAAVSLTADDAGGLSVKPAGATVIGADPRLTWDQRAMMAEQLKKMGLRLEPQGDAP